MSAYSDAVIADAPVAYWRLGEASGNPQDSIGSNHVTTVGGTPTYGVAGSLIGDADTAVTFDGSTEYFLVTDHASLYTGDVVTVEAWVKPGETLAHHGILSAGRDGYYLRLDELNKLNFLRSFQTDMVHSTVAVPSGWHHVVATKNGATVKLYIDGVDVTGSVTNATLSNPNSALSIGADDNGNADRFDGTLDEVAVYGVALTPAQVLHHYRVGVSAYFNAIVADQPVGYWPLGEGTGTVADDAIGSNDGTYVNTPTLGAAGLLVDDADTGVTFDLTQSEYVDLGNPVAFQLGTGTIEAWIKTTDSWAGYHGIITKQQTYGLFLVSNVLGAWDWGAGQLRSTGRNLADGRPHHVVMSFQTGVPSGTVIYIDGEVALVTIITAFNHVIDLLIAEGGTGAGQHFNGTIDEAAVYNYVLTQAQIRNHYLLGGRDYANRVRADGAVAHWRFGEASGNPQDSVGTNHVTVVGGTPTYGAPGALIGDADTAVDFPSVNDYFTVPDAAALDLGDGPFSIEVWARRDEDTGAYATALAKGVNAYSVAYAADDKWCLAKEGAAVLAKESGTTPADGVWHHFVVTRANSTTMFVYKDGADVTTVVDTSTTLADTSGVLRIGRETTAGRVGGALDEAALYNYVLTPQQVLAHFRAGRRMRSVALMGGL